MKPYMFFIFPFIFISRRGILIKHLNDECLAQLGEHFLDVEGVMGSSPLALTITMFPDEYNTYTGNLKKPLK